MGILVQGSNREAQHLSHTERSDAIRSTRRILDDAGFTRTLVIAGTGAQSVRETVELCKEAADAGAKYALVLTQHLGCRDEQGGHPQIPSAGEFKSIALHTSIK